MGRRTGNTGERLRTSYWFVPTLMLVGAALLAWATLRVDEAADPEDLPWVGWLVYSGGPEGAHALLGATASSTITVAGVVFSIAIVTLQLASTQFGPRMLANFVKDRGNQVTLGTFVAGFLYSLLVLREVRSGEDQSVPHLSVTVALLLAVAGLSVLIYFVHHVATTIQAPNLIDAIADELRLTVHELLPPADGAGARVLAAPELPRDLDGAARTVAARQVGYVQIIDLERLTAIASEHDLVIRVETRPGRFVVASSTFASVHPAARATDEVVESMSGVITIGARRTSQQDIEFPIRQMVEIAVRALSPAINDPFTASTCVDQIGAGLCEIADRELPVPYILDEGGALRVLTADVVTWEGLVGAAFDQIRQSADFHVTVYLHLLETLAQVAACVTDRDRLEPLLREARLVVDAAERSVPAEADQEIIEQRYDDLVAVVESTRV